MSFMKTSTGKTFFPARPQDTEFDIKDIAHALANLCRFGGHTKKFYSVAQHSMLVADIVKDMEPDSPELELWALMHDASEAYMIDIPSPIKALLPEYKQKEKQLMLLISTWFNLPYHEDERSSLIPFAVKHADAVALVTEARQLMKGGTSEWAPNQQSLKGYAVRIRPMPPGEAAAKFLARYHDLMKRIRRSHKKSA